MQFQKTDLQGVFLIKSPVPEDSRGTFHKTYNIEAFREHGVEVAFGETYLSVSRKDVIRGMHFQSPPAAHEKLVSCVRGAICDVVLDLRLDSSTYGAFVSFEIDASQGESVYIPRGCAHGFLSRADETMVLYQVSSVYSPGNDHGVRFDSFGMPWGVSAPVVSRRDLDFPELKDFRSPF